MTTMDVPWKGRTMSASEYHERLLSIITGYWRSRALYATVDVELTADAGLVTGHSPAHRHLSPLAEIRRLMTLLIGSVKNVDTRLEREFLRRGH
ncbi:MAG: hypothetical protein ACRDRW_14990 [Pseudonocardiaceae bacterium]